MSDDQSRPPPTRSESRVAARWNPRFQIRLMHAFYAISMLAAALATFEIAGLIAGCLIVLTWAWVFSRVPRKMALCEALVAWMLMCCASLGLLPELQLLRAGPRLMTCSNRLKQIGLALHNYADQYKTFPPAYIADEYGRPMHSWRVLILPYMEEERLYAQYRFDEPWDGPNNRQLASQLPDVYSCPKDRRHGTAGNAMTSYFAVVGPRTAWPNGQARAYSEIPDGPPNTLLVIESHSQQVNWMEPRDLDFETAVRLLSSGDFSEDGHGSRGFLHDDQPGRSILVADGGVLFVGHLPSDVARYVLEVDDGGPKVNAIRDYQMSARRSQASDGKLFQFSVFLLLTILPAFWVVPRADARHRNEGTP